MSKSNLPGRNLSVPPVLSLKILIISESVP